MALVVLRLFGKSEMANYWYAFASCSLFVREYNPSSTVPAIGLSIVPLFLCVYRIIVTWEPLTAPDIGSTIIMIVLVLGLCSVVSLVSPFEFIVASCMHLGRVVLTILLAMLDVDTASARSAPIARQP
jgi:hypothetical protein